MKNLIKALTVVALASAYISSYASVEADKGTLDGYQIMEKVKWREDGENRKSNLDITLTEKDGFIRKREVSYYEKDYGKDRKTFLYVNEPSDVRSTAILINSYDEAKKSEDDTWLYIPALRKVKRLASRNKQGRFVGSEFIFADMERLHLADYQYELLEEDTINERAVFKVDAIASSDKTTEKTGYSRRVIWVDTERFVVLREQYFDAQGVLLKELTTNKVKNISSYWIATDQTLVNHQSGRKTQLEISNLEFNKPMSDIIFSKQTMKRGPRK